MSSKQENFYTTINNFYETQKAEMSKKINITKEYEYVFVNDNDIDYVEIYLDGKLKLKGEYNIIGMYNIPLSIWYWSWNIAFVNKQLMKKIFPLKNSANDLITKYTQFNKKDADELHYILTNGNFYISGEGLDKLLKFVIYQTNGIWYFPVKHTVKNKNSNPADQDKIEYILITKIIQMN
ncbi:hypothetical protein QKU48_gp0420 [Fadolivirus algeromassiliense]|jgi:hypothetical protein|uniref:Uncharacterized protein n=1 Tax=Fadolivirus FV1/VV64 TaxID=3070911 RepID=A0A7D3R1L3_9VIRU|nr:hypothetical protein QKU48_gp0420 [Fadolivirus algeromassiliense]QKF93878.1 hypothetical protein Fadolivirus_1_420 [Fadolivirus FV1/VV64]